MRPATGAQAGISRRWLDRLGLADILVPQKAGMDYRDEQYDLLVKELFRKLHHMADDVHICFAKRGNKSRNAG